MPLPKASDFDGPVANPPLSGPAVDFLRDRKECPEFQIDEPQDFDEELDRNWLALRDRVREGTKRFLVEADAALALHVAAKLPSSL